MRPPEPFRLQAIDLLRAGPTLWAAQYDHWPVRTRGLFRAAPSGSQDVMNFVHSLIEYYRHSLVHQCRIVPLDEERLVAVSDEQRS